MTAPITAREALEAAADLLESEAKKLEVRAFTRSINCRAQARQCRDAAAALSVQPAREAQPYIENLNAWIAAEEVSGYTIKMSTRYARELVGLLAALAAAPAPVETGWQDIATAPDDREFYAPNRQGVLFKVKRFKSPFGHKDAVIDLVRGKWWRPDYWIDVPPLPGSASTGEG